MNSMAFMQYLTLKKAALFQRRYSKYVRACEKQGRKPKDPDAWLDEFYGELVSKVNASKPQVDREAINMRFRKILTVR